MKHRILITDNDLGDSQLESDLLRRHLNAEVMLASCVTEEDVLAAVATARPDAIIVQWAPLTERVLEAAKECRVVSRIGIGVDMIDTEAAARRNIRVMNVPHYCTEEVATHSVALALALWRRLPQLEADLRGGKWESARWAHEIGRLSDATVGLVGLGRIGTLVARAFEVWGTRIVVSDPAPDSDDYAQVELDELFATADIISLHAPLTPGTQHIINRATLRGTARRPILINTSRGGLIDTSAVVEAVRDGHLAGAGLDVFEDEPLATDSALRTLSNVILTPHAAWCSRAALPELREQAALNVVEALQP